MLNWCENELIIRGVNVKECFDVIRSNNRVLDFERIIPMPQILHEVESGSLTDWGLVILGHELGKAERALSYSWVTGAGVTDIEGLKALLKERYPEAEAMGRKALQALQETSYISWYEWSVGEWGTKWNASNPSVEIDEPNRAKIAFSTAWSPPQPVVVALSSQFPKLTFTLRYWEGGGGFKGVLKCKNGEILEESSSSYSGPRGG